MAIERVIKYFLERGNGRLSQALRGMINMETKFTTTFCGTMRLRDSVIYMDPENPRVVVLFSNVKGIRVSMLMVFDLEHVLNIAEILLHKESGYYKDLSDENVSVIKEICNIMMGYYIDELRNVFEANFELPALSVNPFKVLEFLSVGKVYIENPIVMVFFVDFTIGEGEGVSRRLVFLFRREDLISEVNSHDAS